MKAGHKKTAKKIWNGKKSFYLCNPKTGMERW